MRDALTHALARSSVSAGPDLFAGALPIEEGPAGVDVSTVIRQRAASGVSVHVDQNARLLAQAARVETSRAHAAGRAGVEPTEAGEGAPPPLLPARPAHCASALAELWQWCAAVDSARQRMLQSERDRVSGGGSPAHRVEELELWSRIGASHPATGAALARAGACSLIEDGEASDATTFGPLAGWDSAGRRVVAALCGWGESGEGEALSTRCGAAHCTGRAGEGPLTAPPLARTCTQGGGRPRLRARRAAVRRPRRPGPRGALLAAGSRVAQGGRQPRARSGRRAGRGSARRDK